MINFELEVLLDTKGILKYHYKTGTYLIYFQDKFNKIANSIFIEDLGDFYFLEKEGNSWGIEDNDLVFIVSSETCTEHQIKWKYFLQLLHDLRIKDEEKRSQDDVKM